ncbi:MAG TPA: fibronectin type III domain-containing protein [Geopsychrobacteraceae bacterium]|nr:fibronectin type III domain-containing protein [Geopsychrobacteraceae bacterium]
MSNNNTMHINTIGKIKIGFVFLFILTLTTLMTACGSDVGEFSGSNGSVIGGGIGSEVPATGGDAESEVPAITLAWDESSDQNIAGYKVYYNSGEATFPPGVFGANEGTSPIDVGNSTTATISGLSEAELYYVTVTAYDSSGNESTFSNIVSTYPN